MSASKSVLLVGRRLPMPRDREMLEPVPLSRRAFAPGLFHHRPVTVPSDRYWQAHYVTDTGHIIYAYLDLDACARLTRRRAGLFDDE